MNPGQKTARKQRYFNQQANPPKFQSSKAGLELSWSLSTTLWSLGTFFFNRRTFVGFLMKPIWLSIKFKQLYLVTQMIGRSYLNLNRGLGDEWRPLFYQGANSWF